MRLEKWRVVDRLRQRIGGVRRGSDSIVYGLGPSGRRLLARMGLLLSGSVRPATSTWPTPWP